MKSDDLIRQVFESEVNTVRDREPPQLLTEELRAAVKRRRGAFRSWVFEVSGVIAATLICCMTIVFLGNGEASTVAQEITAQIPADAEERFIRFFEMVSRSL
ncbi:MAG: hypothetical protein LBR47_05145 [Spirochaetaceae bacterium]|jgi:hypothetical protein|nr:hypothetical protein [Spirochaetaceae bacterium]